MKIHIITHSKRLRIVNELKIIFFLWSNIEDDFAILCINLFDRENWIIYYVFLYLKTFNLIANVSLVTKSFG